MKHRLTRFVYGLCALWFLMSAPGFEGTDAIYAQQSPTVVRPEITKEALINPDMGWYFYQHIIGDFAYGARLPQGDTLDWFPGCAGIYFHVTWAQLEPREGKYRWDMIDTITRPWIEKGKKIAFRLTTSSKGMVYATPKWVQDAGAKMLLCKNDKPGPEREVHRQYPNYFTLNEYWDPIFDDPVYLQKLDNFLAAMAKRYDGNPDVTFIDTSTYGMWGEGWTKQNLTREEKGKMVKIHIDLFCKNFKKTLLVMNDDFDGPERDPKKYKWARYALERGLTMRDDSAFVHKYPKAWFHANMAEMFWRDKPIIIEMEHYAASLRLKTWEPERIQELLDAYHVSWLSIQGFPDVFLKDNRKYIEDVNLRLGYRLELREISFLPKAKLGEPFKFETKWANVGVAPCYPGGYVSFTLKDDKGTIVWSTTDESFDVRSLEVAARDKAPVRTVSHEATMGCLLPLNYANKGNHVVLNGLFYGVLLKPGTYDLFVSVGQRDGKPVIALPLKNDDGKRRYKVGRIEVALPGSVQPIKKRLAQ